jgi:hypothetical protein
VNVWDEFAATVIGDAGLVEVPAGRPDNDTETDPLNPFNPTMATVNGTLVLPCTRLADVGENGDTTDTEKSGAGGGGVELPGPPPQVIIGNVDSNEIRQTSPCRYLTALSPLKLTNILHVEGDRVGQSVARGTKLNRD